ncbi:CBS domain-containing protein [Mangrovihabitans endophyticus]|uniref:BON domain-containing protein n=1 Tax=Mangrovihabitans endophyticus TaxID=1751298 RepID=A0A8J3FM67_9ACTN|nr:CBS domain-containing protein [Mangrovihabitans endophyticus]GGK77022.1 hypothetical protein GCM10012284_08750 [Mangrovihabitans endophyticus]
MKNWTVDDVMTKKVVSVPQTASYREVVDLLVGRRISAVPVVDEFQHVTGVVSEADLLRKIEYAGDDEPRLFERRRRRGERAKALAGTAAELMSSPPVVTRAGTPIAAAARAMDAEQVKRLPVVDDRGLLIGIVTRGDLLKVHLRPDEEIRADIVSGVLGKFRAEDVGPVTVAVDDGVVTMAGRVARRSAADLAVRLARQVSGVVRVIDEIEFDFDDSEMLINGGAYGVA